MMLPNKLDDKIVAELEQMILDIKAGNAPTNPSLDRAVRLALLKMKQQPTAPDWQSDEYR